MGFVKLNESFEWISSEYGDNSVRIYRWDIAGGEMTIFVVDATEHDWSADFLIVTNFQSWANRDSAVFQLIQTFGDAEVEELERRRKVAALPGDSFQSNVDSYNGLVIETKIET